MNYHYSVEFLLQRSQGLYLRVLLASADEVPHFLAVIASVQP